jgi:hypothetical protein
LPPPLAFPDELDESAAVPGAGEFVNNIESSWFSLYSTEYRSTISSTSFFRVGYGRT